VRFDADLLETLGALLLVKGGMAERAAATVASHVMGNALRGVDSHGVVRFAQYREQIVV
jgi:LDH2 family malate/lactate/ureidoglycolate dehydrogenase